MKSFLLICLLTPTLGFSLPAVAQGMYYFSNHVRVANLDAPILDADGNRLAGPNYVAMLYERLGTRQRTFKRDDHDLAGSIRVGEK